MARDIETVTGIVQQYIADVQKAMPMLIVHYPPVPEP